MELIIAKSCRAWSVRRWFACRYANFCSEQVAWTHLAEGNGRTRCNVQKSLNTCKSVNTFFIFNSSFYSESHCCSTNPQFTRTLYVTYFNCVFQRCYVYATCTVISQLNELTRLAISLKNFSRSILNQSEGKLSTAIVWFHASLIHSNFICHLIVIVYSHDFPNPCFSSLLTCT